MDSKGYWHSSEEAKENANRMVEQFTGKRDRPVIEVEIGEMVAVVKSDGSRLGATFDAAERNRVTLTPQDNGQPAPYLELAENVTLERATGESVRAQVWDNRKGKLILRTLPL